VFDLASPALYAQPQFLPLAYANHPASLPITAPPRR